MSDEQKAREIADSVAGYIAEPRRTELADDITTALQAARRESMEAIPMVLYCPECGEQHIDEATEGWDNPPHRSHLCHACKCIWRPADVPTTGVHGIETVGQADTWSVHRDATPAAIRTQAADDKATIERLTRERDEARARGQEVWDERRQILQDAGDDMFDLVKRAEAAEAQVAALAAKVEGMTAALAVARENLQHVFPHSRDRRAKVEDAVAAIDAALSTTAPEREEPHA